MKEWSKLKQKNGFFCVIYVFFFSYFSHLYIHIIINVWTFSVRFFSVSLCILLSSSFDCFVRSAVCVLLFKELNVNCESRCNEPLLSAYLSRYGVQASASEKLCYPFYLCVLNCNSTLRRVCVVVLERSLLSNMQRNKYDQFTMMCIFHMYAPFEKENEMKFLVKKKTSNILPMCDGTHTVLAHSFDLAHSHSIHCHTQRDKQRSIETYLCMQLSANSDERATHTLSRQITCRVTIEIPVNQWNKRNTNFYNHAHMNRRENA